MTIVLNGKRVEVESGCTVLNLLEGKGMSPETVVVELNKKIVPADAFGETELNDDDHLEVLRFVGGG